MQQVVLNELQNGGLPLPLEQTGYPCEKQVAEPSPYGRPNQHCKFFNNIQVGVERAHQQKDELANTASLSRTCSWVNTVLNSTSSPSPGLLYHKSIARCGLSQPPVMGIVACKAAYAGGEDWLAGLLGYLADNLSFLRNYLTTYIPGVKLVEPEGTYLVWLDFNGLGLDSKALNELITSRAGLWLDNGPMFGAGGDGFQRVNIACPRVILQEALSRLENALT